MSNVAIRVEGLHKQYRLGGAQQRYKTLRDSIANAALRPFRRWRNKDHQDPVDSSLFWALKDVSFEIKAGEVVGVIGRNGAGKSTLLKVLSRITEPTAGYAEIHGRVGSLLEVGTGFHPELSGRENIYLNGAILGMKRTEVERKFDEIVSFAEVEQFVDTPVKFYSSGMYLRLAFAVAAHLEPEILLVDEVLAVGDVAFQNKCLGKMQDISTNGKTVLFVSHNIGAIASLCQTVLVLDSGSVVCRDMPDQAIPQYVALTRVAPQRRNAADDGRTSRIRISSIQVLNIEDQPASHICSGDFARFRIGYEASSSVSLRQVHFEIKLRDSLGAVVLTLSTYLKQSPFALLSQSGLVECILPVLPLSPDDYEVEVNCTASREIQEVWRHAAHLTVLDGTFYGNGTRIKRSVHGAVLAQHDWNVCQ